MIHLLVLAFSIFTFDTADAQTYIYSLPGINVDSIYGTDLLILDHTGAHGGTKKLTIRQLIDSLVPGLDGSSFVDFTGGASISPGLTVGGTLTINDSAVFHGAIHALDTTTITHAKFEALGPAVHSLTPDSMALSVDSNGNALLGCYFGCGDTSNGALASRHYVDSLVGWGLTGNAGTNPAVNFLGTTDSVDFIIRTKSYPNIELLNAGRFIGIGDPEGFNNNTYISVNDNFGSQAIVLAADNLIQLASNNQNITLQATSGKVEVLNSPFQIVDGTQGDGKVLTSDASGNASWQAPSLSDTLVIDTISSAQILNCNSVYDTLLPPPGIGYQWNVISIQGNLNYITGGGPGVAYTSCGQMGIYQGQGGAVINIDNNIFQICGFNTPMMIKASPGGGGIIGTGGGGGASGFMNSPVFFGDMSGTPLLGNGFLTVTIIARRTL